jgi:hypothetical protein
MDPVFLLLGIVVVVLGVGLMGGLVFLVIRSLTRNAGGGWSVMRRQFAIDHEPTGQKFTWQSVQVGAVVGKNSTTVIIGPEGLYLRAPMLGAMLVPWSAIRGAAPTRLYWRDAVVLKVGDPPSSVTVYRAVYEAMRPYLPRPKDQPPPSEEEIVPPELVEVHT